MNTLKVQFTINDVYPDETSLDVSAETNQWIYSIDSGNIKKQSCIITEGLRKMDKYRTFSDKVYGVETGKIKLGDIIKKK